MSDYIKTKEYKFPDGETMTAYFDEYGIAKITIQALDAIFDNFINSADRVEVVRCKDCKHRPIDTQEEGNGFDYEFLEEYGCPGYCDDGYYAQRFDDNFYCAWGERAES